jgi:hypothetical protein
MQKKRRFATRQMFERGTKECIECRRVLPLDDFYLRSELPLPKCKVCHTEAVIDRYWERRFAGLASNKGASQHSRT